MASIQTNHDLSGQVTGLVGSDGGSNDGAGDTGGTAKSHLAGNHLPLLAEDKNVSQRP
jgi:hypothetical protein